VEDINKSAFSRVMEITDGTVYHKILGERSKKSSELLVEPSNRFGSASPPLPRKYLAALKQRRCYGAAGEQPVKPRASEEPSKRITSTLKRDDRRKSSRTVVTSHLSEARSQQRTVQPQ
jgi:hypothetical protein